MASIVTRTADRHHIRRQRAISRYWSDFLINGDQDGRYGTSHQAVFAFALVAARAGWTPDDYIAAMSDPRNRLGDHYRSKDVQITWEAGRPIATGGRRRTEANRHGRMVRDWTKASRLAADTPRFTGHHEVMQHLGLVCSAMASTPWTGRAGLRDRTVLAALLTVAESQPTACPTISTRALCELTPYRNHVTVVNALRSLKAKGWVAPDRSRSSHDQPSAYRLLLPDVSQTSPASDPPGRGQPAGEVRDSEVSLTGPVDRADQDLGIALTPHAALIHATLDPDIPQSVASVVRRSGASRATVNRWLLKLALIGLARKSPRGWLQGQTDVTLVAVEQGALDQAEKRQVRHSVDRECWARSSAYEHARRHGASVAEAEVAARDAWR